LGGQDIDVVGIMEGNIFLLPFVGELDLHGPLQLGAN
jgi:hypothetical protein